MKNILLRLVLATSVTASLIVAFLSSGIFSTQAFEGPNAGAGVGAGALGIDASRNLSVGTSSPIADTKFFILASSTGNIGFAMKIFQPGSGPLFVVRNDGTVAVGQPIPPGASTSTLIVGGNLLVNGTITSLGSAGNVSAGNVTAGVFGSGNFAFPSSLGLNTSTQVGLPQNLSVYGGGYFSGNVGIGVPTTPSEKLVIAGGVGLMSWYGSGLSGSTYEKMSVYTDATNQVLFEAPKPGNLTANAYDYNFSWRGGGAGLFIDGPTGNVGIGMAGAGQKLDVNGVSRFRDTVYYGASDEKGTISWGAIAGGNGFGMIAKSGLGLSLGANNAWDQLVISTAGNVGIGTASPGAKLHVLGLASVGTGSQAVRGGGLNVQWQGSGNADIFFGDYTNGWAFGENVDASFRIFKTSNGTTLSSTPFVIQAAGNVGIGTGSANAKLTVYGTNPGAANNAAYDIGAGKIAAGTSIYSYGSICASNASSDCSGAGGVVMSATGVKFPDGTTQTTAAGAGSSGWTDGGANVTLTTAGDNVGVGTTPADKLHVAGNVLVDSYKAFIARYTSNDAYRGHFQWDHMQMGNNGANYIVAGSSAIGGSLKFVVNNTNDLTGLYADTNKNGTVAMTVLSNANIGLGTESPGYKLHVAGDVYANGGWFRVSGANGIYWETHGGGWYMADSTWMRTYNDKSVWTNAGLLGSNGGLTVGYGGTTPPSTGAIIAGDLGIGTASPVYKLDVNGDMRAAGGGRFNNIGIGTLIPDRKLHVVSGLGENHQVRLTSLAGLGQALELYEAGTKRGTLTSGATVVALWNQNDQGINIRQDNNRVGIGVTAPVERLEVDGNIRINNTLSTAGRMHITGGEYLYVLNTNGLIVSQAWGGNGNIYAEGTIGAAGAKTFIIDHPTKPDTKLIHAAIEGPEAAVYYRGEAKLADGKTTVVLPDYFEALVRDGDRTVLLTPKFENSDEAVSALAASSVKDGKFSVKAIDGRNPIQAFYWEVKAIRGDIDPLTVERAATKEESTKVEKPQ